MGYPRPAATRRSRSFRPDGTIGRKRESAILDYVSEMTVKQARKEAEKKLSAVNTIFHFDRNSWTGTFRWLFPS